VLDMRERGVHVALGQDASALDDDDDFLRDGRLAWQLQFRPGVHGSALTATDVFGLIYRGGARALGLPGQVGLLAPGARADLIGLSLERTGQPREPTPDIVASHVLQWMRSQNVRWVMVDGAEVVHDGRLCSVDEDAIQREVERAVGSAPPTPATREMFAQLQAHVRAYYATSSPGSNG
jgi:5-methylthioadenosine/S-adenosylhomocysteine deaminase